MLSKKQLSDLIERSNGRSRLELVRLIEERKERVLCWDSGSKVLSQLSLEEKQLIH